MPIVTPLCAALSSILFIALGAHVILYRRAGWISLGHAVDTALLQRIHAQANCADHAPLGLRRLLIAELQELPIEWLHLL